MNTNLLLVTNVPRTIRPQDIVHQLENKWARAITLDNPYWDLFDVFVYNPTTLGSHLEHGVKQLREMVVEGIMPLKVYHLWFPPPNVFLTNLIPNNSTMLPFLFVDNLPKDCDTSDIVGSLPFQQNEVRHWDVPQKEDKWMILRLPANQDDGVRDYVLKYIRSRQLSNGLYPRVLEVFATEDIRLSKDMIPKKIDILPITNSYKSNLLFLYDLPTKVTIMSVFEAAKSLNVRGTKTFFIDVIDGLRVGFLFVPRSFPSNRFQIFQEQLKEKEIMLDNKLPIFLNINEVFLQPYGAMTPHQIEVKGDDRTVEYVLSNYLYIHNVTLTISANQLMKETSVNFKIHLFQISDSLTQVGLICIREFTESNITLLIKHLRSLIFDGNPVMVDNIYLKCYDLPENYSERREVHVPRSPISNGEQHLTLFIPEKITEVKSEIFETYETLPDVDNQVSKRISKVEIANEPPLDYNLMKSDFIYVNKLPIEVESSLFSYLNIEDKAITIMSSGSHKASLIYYPDTTPEMWLSILENVATTRIKGHFVEVSEVYLQSEESSELIHCPLPGLKPSKYIFVYNIADCSDTRKLEEHANVVRFSTMDTESGSCAFVELVNDLSSEETIDTLCHIRNIKLDGVNLCADLIWLGNVKVNHGDKVAMRNKWLKKPSDSKAKRLKQE